MFKIFNLTAKNFLSVGNITQSINFDRTDLTLILGENLDLGGDENRNGCGKSLLINALSYVLYGQALSDIKKDNLINRTNLKGMLVTIDFEKNGTVYRIERGRKPGILVLTKGEVAFEAKDNDAQGDSRETQNEINQILDMSHEMFKHIVALNTYTEPFLSLKSNDQRNIIEQLLGITVLSEKAELLKEAVRKSKDVITAEEYRIKAEIEANKKIEEQITSLRRRQQLWATKHTEEVTSLQTSLDDLLTIDIEDELTKHKALAEYGQKKKDIADIDDAISRGRRDLNREENGIAKLVPEIEALLHCKCHSCGQEIHTSTQEQLLSVKQSLLLNHTEKVDELKEYISSLSLGKEALGVLGIKPVTSYNVPEDAMHHKSTVSHLQNQIAKKILEENPYNEQITEMETTALSVIDYEVINATTKLKEHQEFLLKLLTNKDSFIRKRIIDQNLTYLNTRLSHYLSELGLPHTVVFQNDLTVTIEEFGRDMSYFNLSRGEMSRVILALSLSFRDVWETLFSTINLLFIDEMIDNGIDSAGVENAIKILKRIARNSNKSVWLISHKDELQSRVDNILYVQKEGGFTNWITEK